MTREILFKAKRKDNKGVFYIIQNFIEHGTNFYYLRNMFEGSERMAKLIKNWKELSKVKSNDKYEILIDNDMCNGWIKPIKETKETEDNYFEHHVYLSTHTFYGSHYKYSTEILQKYGFDVEIDNWDKGAK